MLQGERLHTQRRSRARVQDGGRTPINSSPPSSSHFQNQRTRVGRLSLWHNPLSALGVAICPGFKERGYVHSVARALAVQDGGPTPINAHPPLLPRERDLAARYC